MSARQEQGPNASRRRRRRVAQSLPAGLVLLVLLGGDAAAQTLTSDLLRGERDGFSGLNRPLRRTTDTARDGTTTDATATARPSGDPAPSRIGRLPKFEAPAASGAAAIGYDSLGRKKKKSTRQKAGVSPTVAPRQPVAGPPVQITPTIVPVVPPPPPLPSAATANRPRLAPSMMGTVVGQPQRRRLRVDDDPFGAVGFYRGSMLFKPAIELSAGYDTNPGRIRNGRGSPFYVVAPELLIASDWQQHSLIADLRGSFTSYSRENESGSGTLPVNIDRPDFNGKISGRLDISRDTRIDTESRLRVGTDNPGSPNIQANLARYPLFASYGKTLGAAHSYNRFEIAARGTADRTVYQESTLSNGERSSNTDRNFNQYGGSLRGSYELLPQVKPFGEVSVDVRDRDVELDRNGFARSSRGRTARVGSTFELGALITGEASIGYTRRSYEDARLRDASGLLTAASLIWKPTGLTTVTFGAQSSIDESTLPGVSGVITRSYNAQVEHAFRRYLIATAKAGFTTADYEGADRFDKIYSVGGDIVYKFTRDLHFKAQLRRDWLESSIPTASYRATLFMLGVRLQR